MTALGQAQQLSFSALVLRCQDDAYTLAYYLLGDEEEAARATQAAFARVQRLGSLPQSRFRLEVLRGVLKCARGEANAHPGAVQPNDAISRMLLGLRSEDRTALVLVDILSLSYAEAAQVLGCSKQGLAKRLGHARLNLSRAVSVR